MLNPWLVITRKEITDALRDTRSLISSVLFALMGPLVVGLVSLSPAMKGANNGALVGLMSVFTLVAAFSGGVNVAMDTLAGERERRSLLPLLLNPMPRRDIVAGKWLAVSLFSVAGLALNLAGFAGVFLRSGMQIHASLPGLVLAMALGVFPLPLLAAALQLLLSTACRSMKEAQTYLSLIVFLPMGIGMLLVFFPAARQAWLGDLPVLGQQLELQRLMDGRGVPLLESLALGAMTLMLTLLVVKVICDRLQHDEIVYGN